jgi:hypothetical protein
MMLQLGRAAILAGVLAAGILNVAPATAGSLRFTENRPAAYEFADLARLPAGFGDGEFSFEIWIKPDASAPVGTTMRASYAQLRNWSDADPRPYSAPGWWLPGNWLIDGHSRPDGYGPADSREGTFSLQFYGGGRLRWMFADTAVDMPPGMVWAVQAWPATGAPSLLDGRWHHVVAVRRWREGGGARLELWIDGRLTAATDVPHRTDMRRFWDQPAHPRDPAEIGGWAIGAEVMTAWNYAFTQYEDYKGLVDDIRMWRRALDPDEVARLATGAAPARREGVVAHYSFDEGRGHRSRDAVDATQAITLHRWSRANWSREDGPASARTSR